jgi:hypothetical protein
MSERDGDGDDDDGHGDKKPKRLMQQGLGSWQGFSVKKKIQHRNNTITVPLEVANRVPKLDLLHKCPGCSRGFMTAQAMGGHALHCEDAKTQKKLRKDEEARKQVHLQFPMRIRQEPNGQGTSYSPIEKIEGIPANKGLGHTVSFLLLGARPFSQYIMTTRRWKCIWRSQGFLDAIGRLFHIIWHVYQVSLVDRFATLDYSPLYGEFLLQRS